VASIITPPYRTPLGNGSGTTKDWWLFWKNLGDLGNAGMKMLTYGAHGDRPDAAGMPNGALYIETDRGDVIYQAQAGIWHYLAGLMFGTLVPDQRPTDLGVNDAGFDFRTSVNPPREFMWSQTAWVEIGGGVTTQNIVTGSRAIGTVYRNTTGKPMFVNMICSCANSTGAGAYTDAAASPTTFVGGVVNASATPVNLTVSFWVLPMNYYKITGSGTNNGWVEWY
jgi:hypothetical protein